MLREKTMSLNAHQIEILKLFSRDMEEADFIAIKRLIVQYLGNKITTMVDQVWEDKGWEEKDMERLLNMHERTPYNPNN